MSNGTNDAGKCTVKTFSKKLLIFNLCINCVNTCMMIYIYDKVLIEHGLSTVSLLMEVC